MGEKPWFGPKRWLGWGWAPCSWEGWLVAVVGIGGCIVAARAQATVVVLLVAAGELAVGFLKGTSPGGAEEYESLHPRTLLRGGGDDTPSIQGIVDNFDERDSR